MKNTLTLLLTISMAAIAAHCVCSCTNAPTPTITLEAPEEGSEFYPGNDIHFSAILEDSRGLVSYQIEVNCISEDENNSLDAVPFSYQDTWELSNEKEAYLHHHDVIIPQDAALGRYLFTLSCTNRAGKEARVSVNVGIIEVSEE